MDTERWKRKDGPMLAGIKDIHVNIIYIQVKLRETLFYNDNAKVTKIQSYNFKYQCT